MKTRATHRNKIIHNKQTEKIQCKHFEIYKNDFKRILTIQISDNLMPLNELKEIKGIKFFHCIDLSNEELISAITSVDFVLIIINENIDEIKLKFVKNFLNTNYLIVYKNNENIKKSDVRRFVKGNFNKPNILSIDQLYTFLKNYKIKDNEISNKIFSNEIKLNNNFIEFSGFARKKLTSKLITINNLFKCEIIESSNENIFQEIEIENYLEKIKYSNNINNNYDNNQSSSNDSEDNINDSSDDNLLNEEENNNNSSLNFLIPKDIRENYKPLSFFKNNSFSTNEIPEIYSNLFFIKKKINSEELNKEINLILKPINCSLEDILKSNIFILSDNIFEQINKTYFSIYNIFLNKIPNSNLTVLLNSFLKINCLVTENNEISNNNDIRKLKDSGDSISFIAPLFNISNLKNLKFFQNSNSSSLDISDFLFSSKQVTHHNICILQEHIIYGKVLKIYEKFAKIRMFSCKEESKLFMKNKVYTKNNIGVITKTIGSKGLIKCLFERPVKYGEDIKMFIYRRLFLPICY